jgi:polysaccharide export outer membrane protein
MRGHRLMLLTTGLFSLLSAGAMAQTLQEHFPEYHLQRSDSVTVSYRYTPEYDQTVVVGPDGRANLSGFGAFVATGLTLDEFREQILKLSMQRLLDPVVAVTLKDFEKPHFYVEGEVNTPGRVELIGNVSALDAIAMAGGFKPSGAMSNVLLLRSDDESRGKTRVLDLKRLIAQHKLEEVPALRSGDVIYVTQNTLSKVERLVHMGNFGAIYNPMR